MEALLAVQEHMLPLARLQVQVWAQVQAQQRWANCQVQHMRQVVLGLMCHQVEVTMLGLLRESSGVCPA